MSSEPLATSTVETTKPAQPKVGTDRPRRERADTPSGNGEDTRQVQEAWDRIATGYDQFVTPSHLWLGQQALQRAGLQPGMRFLDVAAGSGALSIPAARLGAKVLATDLSPVMLEQLRRRAESEGLEIETRLMDGHALELEDGAFDMSGSQFGVMLFPDMPRGICEMARATRPGGRVLMVAYGDPQKIDFLQFFVRAIRRAVPDFPGIPDNPPPLPLQLQDPKRLRRKLVAAGLRQVGVETLTESLVFENGDGLWKWLMNSNPITGAILAELTLNEEQREVVRQALVDLVRERAQGGRATLTNPIHVGLGSR